MTAAGTVARARYAVVGAGAAGSSFVRALAAAGAAGPVLLVDDGSTPLDDRVWAAWQPVLAGRTGVPDAAVSRTWSRLAVGSGSSSRLVALRRYRYVAVLGADLRRTTDEALGVVGGQRLEATAYALRDDGDGVVVTTSAGELRADRVLDSVGLLAGASEPVAWMSFHGSEVQTDGPALDPGVVRLMDFDVPQRDGVAFAYVLPWSPDRALVELTRIGRLPADAGMADDLAAYLDRMIGTERHRLVRTESGALPLHTGAPRPRSGRCLSVGVAGGLLKASTGYGYERIRRDSARLVAALGDDRPPGRSGRLRHRLMDAVFLDLALDEPSMLPVALERLFARNPADRVLRFLDEDTTLADEARLVASLPFGPFTRAALRHPGAARRRRAPA